MQIVLVFSVSSVSLLYNLILYQHFSNGLITQLFALIAKEYEVNHIINVTP